MTLTSIMEKRRSIRKFKSKAVKLSHVIEIMDAGLNTPLAGNISTLKFIVLTDQNMKNNIAEYSDQHWISSADTIIVVCSDETRLKTTYKEHATVYAKQQVGAAVQNMLLRITELGLGACWVGSYLEYEIKNILDIPSHVNIEAIIPIGYADEKPKAKHKESLENNIFWDKWNVRKKPTLIKDPKTW